MTPSKSDAEKTAEAQQADQAKTAAANYNTVSTNNEQLNGPVQDTDYYKNETKAGTAATTAGYDASTRNLKQSMEAAGVTGRSGVAQGNETALSAKEASDLAQVKTNAFADTEAQQLAANSQDLTAAGQQTGAAVNYNGQASEADIARQKIGASNWQSLGNAVTKTATFGKV